MGRAFPRRFWSYRDPGKPYEEKAKLQLEKDRLVQGPSSLQIADQLLAELARNEGLKGIERGTPEKKHLML